MVQGDTAVIRIVDALGAGGVEVASDTLSADDSLTVYAAAYDNDNNFIGNPTGVWSVSGGIGTLTPVNANTSELQARRVGGGSIGVQSGSFSDNTGLITVIAGDTGFVAIRTAAGNAGSRYDALSIVMPSDSSLQLFAAAYDADSNYINDIVVTWDTLANGINELSNFTITSATNILYNPTGTGSGYIDIRYAQSSIRDTTNLITVAAGDTAGLFVETGRNGTGSVIGNLVTDADSAITAYGVFRDNEGNFISMAAGASWSVSGHIGALINVGTDSVVLRLDTVGTGQITAVASGFTGSSGVIEVRPGILEHITIRTDTLNQGQAFGTLTMVVGDSVRLYAAGYDSSGNFISNKEGTFKLLGGLSGVLSYPAAGDSSVG